MSSVPTSYAEIDMLRCPYPLDAINREATPVFLDPETGIYHLLRYEDVRDAARDHVRFSSKTGVGGSERIMSDEVRPEIERIYREEGFFPRDTLVAIDLPDHGLYRALVERVFTPKRVREMEDYIQLIVDELIDGFIDRGEVEFVSEFAIPLPVRIIADQLGVPREEAYLMRQFSEDLLRLTPPIQTLELEVAYARKVVEIQQFFAKKYEEVARSGKDCLLSALGKAEVNGRRLNMAELVSTAQTLMFGGNDTTTNSTGNGMRVLIEQPDLRARLTAEPGLIPAFIEEVLRAQSPVQALPRITTEDVAIDDFTIPQGALVMLRWGSANRDPRQYANPETIDLDRPHKTMHMAFGYGTHICIGNQLARGEMRVAFTTLLKRLTGFRFAGAPENSYAFHTMNFSYGLEYLNMAFAKA